MKKMSMKDFNKYPRTLNTLAMSILFDQDSYKYTQPGQYPSGMDFSFNYIEPRVGKRGFEKIVFFGLQILLHRLVGTQITEKHVEYMAQLAEAHFMSSEVFEKELWMYIVKKHNGYLPLKIMAVPEGTVMTRGNIQVAVTPTDPACAWLCSPVETFLQRVWKMSTVCTLSWNSKQLLRSYLEQTCDLPADEVVRFKLHDFGSRGVGGPEDAALCGLANLVNFAGTDTFLALLMGQEAYFTDAVLGGSIPAAEHSTITSWGREGEVDAIRNLIRLGVKKKVQFIASPADSYNFYNFVDNIIGKEVKEELIASGLTFVVRPDSGNPVEMVRYALKSLANSYGTTTNNKGFKVLHNSVRIIQGDGINYESMKDILDMCVAEGFSTENVTFGMGGALLQKHDRDELNYAMKCAYIEVEGVGRDVKKDPITDPGKVSKAGKLCLIRDGFGNTQTVRAEELMDRINLLQVVYEWDGRNRLMSERPFVISEAFETIRERAGF